MRLLVLVLVLAGCGAVPCKPLPCDAGRYTGCVADEPQVVDCRALGAMCEDGIAESYCRFPEPTP